MDAWQLKRNIVKKKTTTCKRCRRGFGWNLSLDYCLVAIDHAPLVETEQHHIRSTISRTANIRGSFTFWNIFHVSQQVLARTIKNTVLWPPLHLLPHRQWTSGVYHTHTKFPRARPMCPCPSQWRNPSAILNHLQTLCKIYFLLAGHIGNSSPSLLLSLCLVCCFSKNKSATFRSSRSFCLPQYLGSLSWTALHWENRPIPTDRKVLVLRHWCCCVLCVKTYQGRKRFHRSFRSGYSQ